MGAVMNRLLVLLILPLCQAAIVIKNENINQSETQEDGNITQEGPFNVILPAIGKVIKGILREIDPTVESETTLENTDEKMTVTKHRALRQVDSSKNTKQAKNLKEVSLSISVTDDKDDREIRKRISTLFHNIFKDHLNGESTPLISGVKALDESREKMNEEKSVRRARRNLDLQLVKGLLVGQKMIPHDARQIDLESVLSMIGGQYSLDRIESPSNIEDIMASASSIGPADSSTLASTYHTLDECYKEVCQRNGNCECCDCHNCWDCGSSKHRPVQKSTFLGGVLKTVNRGNHFRRHRGKMDKCYQEVCQNGNCDC